MKRQWFSPQWFTATTWCSWIPNMNKSIQRWRRSSAMEESPSAQSGQWFTTTCGLSLYSNSSSEQSPPAVGRWFSPLYTIAKIKLRLRWDLFTWSRCSQQRLAGWQILTSATHFIRAEGIHNSTHGGISSAAFQHSVEPIFSATCGLTTLGNIRNSPEGGSPLCLCLKYRTVKSKLASERVLSILIGSFGVIIMKVGVRVCVPARTKHSVWLSFQIQHGGMVNMYKLLPYLPVAFRIK